MAFTTPPRRASGKRSSARLDVLKQMLEEKSIPKDTPPSKSASPRDSLSPLAEEFEGRGRSRHAIDLARPEKLSAGMHSCLHRVAGRSSTREATAHPYTSRAGSPQQHNKENVPSFHEGPVTEEATSPSTHVNTTCPPRCLAAHDRRPCDLCVEESNGLTTISTNELRQRICDGYSEHDTTKTQVPRARPRRRSPKTPIREIDRAMGNTHSNTSSPIPDNASVRHHSTRNPVRVLRKSSNNLLRRIESRSPLPPAVSCTAIEARRQCSPPAIDGTKDENDRNGELQEDLDSTMVQSASAVTIRDEGTNEPLSASTTIRQSRSESRADSRRDSRMGERLDSSEEVPQLLPSRPTSQMTSQPIPIPPAPHVSHRASALSPSIPAPSPLPEDSPHKYGLMDRMDTPEVTEQEEVQVHKARRRSSGLEIFNEAKSLQSASSFLNGLSTSRRRAESTQRSTEASAWTLASYDTQRPTSSRLSRPSSRPSSTLPSNTYAADRRRGHNFKPSGFAYTRPLTHVQVKCYKQHSRLLTSGNKDAPVECSVCHIDDDRDHYSCSWCAIRMCRYCRKEFTERGISALRERIKVAEFGGSDETGNSSAESLGGGLSRGRSSFL